MSHNRAVQTKSLRREQSKARLLKSFRREHKKGQRDQPETPCSSSRFTEVWIDASFRDRHVNKPDAEGVRPVRAGGAAIVADKRGVHAIIINDLNTHGVKNSAEAELMNAIVTLETLPYGQVHSFACDATSLYDPMKLILDKGEGAETGLNGHHDRLVKAMQRHPQMDVRLVRRTKEQIPMAHAFAKFAARNDYDGVEDELSVRFQRGRPALIYTGSKPEPAPALVLVKDFAPAAPENI